MLNLYSKCLSPLSLVQEPQSTYFSLTEQHLQVLWLEQKFFKQLKTVQGEFIEVISPGVWNKEAGPDFLKAHIRIGNRDYRGDVEIHLQENGWYQHHHHQDVRYNQVILHLAYWQPVRSLPINKENGQQAFTSYLDECLTLPMPQLLRLIDLDLYPSKAFAGSGRCAERLFRTLPEAQTRKLFQSAAYWRLERKGHFLEQHFSQRAWQFAGGVAMALGYKQNAMAFLELFTYLLDYRDLPYEELLALALGCCGFLEEGRQKKWESSTYYQELRLLWWGKRDQITLQINLKLDHIRPLHHPIRRLAYLTRLLQDSQLENLWSLFLQEWEKFTLQTDKNYKKLKNQLLDLLPHYTNSYWDHHYTFESHVQSQYLPGLGSELKMHILLNTYLPLLYASLIEQSSDWQFFQNFYASLEMTLTSKSRYLQQRFFGNEKESVFLEEAQMAQGAYQLHHDFCIHFEASCEGCPFVERYQATH